MTKQLPTFHYEQQYWDQGKTYVAGVDEVGRGCFAGPVVAAAVILPAAFPQNIGINDSKKVLPKKRKELAKIIREKAVAFAIAEISVSVINTLGIGQAAQQAFFSAIQKLSVEPHHILVDAFYIQNIAKDIQHPIIRGDSLSISIAAASIIAKVYRDELMEKMHEKYLAYDFFTNKGYGTPKHRQAIIQYGLSDLHRTSFSYKKTFGKN